MTRAPRVGRAAHGLAASLALLLLAACAGVPRSPLPNGVESLSGRLAVQVEGAEGAAPRSVTAAFELRGDPHAGQLDLSTPLGNVLAQARWAPGTVVLATPQGERNFADLDALTREVLGESLPIAAMFDWLRGRPWPGAASRATVAPTPLGFEQLGWLVNLAGFDDSRVEARRGGPPAVTVRARLDRP